MILGYTNGLKLAFLSATFAVALVFGAEAPAPDSNDPHLALLDRFIQTAVEQGPSKRNLTMEMKFTGALTKMKKTGELTATRLVNSQGHVSFEVHGISGDETVKKYVLAKYLSSEQEVSQKDLNNAINHTNYKFKFKRVEEVDGRVAHVYELAPRKKRAGLIKGELWIDEQSAITLREEGQFVKSPSPLFLKKVTFKRLFAIFEGTSLPKQIFIRTETRLAGPAEMEISYSEFARPGAPPQQAITPAP